jgi:addiction module RelE/StbE family toxin
MAEIVWTTRAKGDLKEIVEYIARDSPAYAKSFALRLTRKIELLARLPRSGHVIPEDPSSGARELIVGSYRVIYRPSDDRIVIITGVHGARQIDPPGQDS